VVKEKPPHTISTRGPYVKNNTTGNMKLFKKYSPIDNFIIAQKRSFVNLGQYGGTQYHQGAPPYQKDPYLGQWCPTFPN
jgi:hypothetical protein